MSTNSPTFKTIACIAGAIIGFFCAIVVNKVFASESELATHGQRIVVLETQNTNTEKKVDSISSDVKDLGKKMDRLLERVK